MATIASNLQAVRAAVAQAAVLAGRKAEDVILLAVSKTFSVGAMREAFQSGQTHFAESYLQEALGKMAALADLPIEWHFIGPIQSNKTRAIAENFAWVHGVDRLKIAERLSQQRPTRLPPLQLCLQVNISNEASKSGIAPDEVVELAREVARLPNVVLRGLMVIPAPTDDISAQHAAFSAVRALRDRLNAQGMPMDTLSMGMSHDFEAAIAEGATIVRVGTAIFGNRAYSTRKNMNICFIGGGNMASALIGGLLGKGYEAAQISVVEIAAEGRARLEREFAVRAVEGLAEGVTGSDIVVLAVKPQQLHEVATALGPLISGQLIVSIAAGIRACDLARWLGSELVVRAMPNTPALIRSGMTGVYALPVVSQAQREQAQAVLAAVGDTLWLQDEKMLDAVTAISGSGPAYVFYFIEALQRAAMEMGFTADEARRLSVSTFLGGSLLAAASSEEVSLLRERVTSKNGTTERALKSMAEHQVAGHIVQAAYAAAARSRELGDELGQVG